MRNLYVDYSYYSEDDEENIKREEEIIDLGYFQDWINDTGRDVWGYDINDIDDVKLKEVLDEYIVEYLEDEIGWVIWCIDDYYFTEYENLQQMTRDIKIKELGL
ncbi:hypothetical protein UFOVP163_20 [uncultured Caudovirales phage]|uniref:Uncharacterized protein n=1 Tax=uncultured Caudovirales phage TaxID=2100421 RepID=A0A6J7WAS2_9CAUD|nr:hypothetical protein UFOVP163_20 [uncultured Caudovirales phage]